VNITYDIDKYYREALNQNPNPSGSSNPKKKLKGWRLACNGGYDHQFFDVAKLDLLEAKEQEWALYQADPSKLAKAPAAFTRKDVTQREALMAAGFANWSKKEFFQFIRLNEQFGRRDIETIAQYLPNKTPQEVAKYAETFWKKYPKIENGQKYVERIEKGEADIERRRLVQEAIDDKLYFTLKHLSVQDPSLQSFSVEDIPYPTLASAADSKKAS